MPGETVRRKTGALLEEHADLVVPVDVVEREGDETELFGLLGVQSRAHRGFRAFHIGRIGLEARLKPRQAMAHRIRAKIHR
ncbi:molybdopterin biosynthesis enzyme [Bradyrhizobium sp. LB7.1]